MTGRRLNLFLVKTLSLVIMVTIAGIPLLTTGCSANTQPIPTQSPTPPKTERPIINTVPPATESSYPAPNSNQSTQESYPGLSQNQESPAYPSVPTTVAVTPTNPALASPSLPTPTIEPNQSYPSSDYTQQPGSNYPNPTQPQSTQAYTHPSTTQTASGYPGPTPTNSLPSATRTSLPTFSPHQTNYPGQFPLPTPSASVTPRPYSTAQPPPRDNLKTVTIWHSWEGSQKQTLDDVLKAFQDAVPDVQFNVLYVPADQLRNKFISEAYQGNGPSLVLGPADWGPTFYDQGLVADLTGIAPTDFLTAINPATLQEVEYKGKLIGLPYSVRNAVLLYRNKQIISKPPASLDELVSLSKSVTKAGFVGAYLERSFFFSAAHLDGIGGKLMDENGNPAFNSPKGEEWLNLLNSFQQAGPTEFNGNRDIEWFKAGKVGFIIAGIWDRGQLAEAIGESNLVIDPWPQAGSGHLSGYLQTNNLYLNANIEGGERYAALQVMGFFLAPQVQSILVRAGQVPSVMDAQVSDPLLQQAMLAMKGATGYPIQPEVQVYWSPLEVAMTSVFQNSVLPAQALQKAESDIRAALQKYRANPSP